MYYTYLKNPILNFFINIKLYPNKTNTQEEYRNGTKNSINKCIRWYRKSKQQ